jgi:hypothetical protein
VPTFAVEGLKVYPATRCGALIGPGIDPMALGADPDDDGPGQKVQGTKECTFLFRAKTNATRLLIGNSSAAVDPKFISSDYGKSCRASTTTLVHVSISAPTR